MIIKNSVRKAATMVVWLCVVVFLLPSCEKARSVSFESLLLEMIDRESIASYPDPYYTTSQFSSYDRASVAPGDSTWFANWDRTMFVREEINQGRKEYVMMETNGPGAIVRFWMTFAGESDGKGILRIYLDNMEEPVIEGIALDILSGDVLAPEPLALSVSPETQYEWRGHNLYLPIPYAAHIKVTYQSDNITVAGAKGSGEAVYYNINYRAYDTATQVETFSMEILEKSKDLIGKVAATLDGRDHEGYMKTLSTQEINLNGEIEPGKFLEQKIQGSHAIRELSLGIDAADFNQALRSTVIEVMFDGKRTVWCPLGDFFGTGYQVRKVDTWYTRVLEDGIMQSWWVMPFSKNATIRIHNLGDQKVSLHTGKLAYSDWKWDKRSMHFGATWLQYTNIYTGGQKNNEGGGGNRDLNFTHLKGEGVIAGNSLVVFNGPTGGWWGEGDEKIYVDGEAFPSHFGTGTEDFFGYAWCRPEVFNTPLIAQPDGSGNFSPGYSVNIRHRLLDGIPFKSELKLDMELWHWLSTHVNYAPASFFYLKPGGEVLVDEDEQGAREKVLIIPAEAVSPEQ